MKPESENPEGSIIMRCPEPEEGQCIYRLVKRSEPLDLNSLYCYLLVCTHFRDTSVVAMKGPEVAGFISAYRIPQKKNTLFIWQVAVDSTMRKKGLAMSMVKNLLQRENLKEISFIETTVTPSNEASASFFRTLSSFLETECVESEYFASGLFGAREHEEERLFTIGPFDLNQ